MPVELFVDGCEPADPHAPIARYFTRWKLERLLSSADLYFCRSDKFDGDPQEGLPPKEYERILRLHPLDIKDIRERDHTIGSIAQMRQSFYVNCWYQSGEESGEMWTRYAPDGVILVSNYSALKTVLEPLPDRRFLGLIRYGTSHLTGWNTIRFITTKREEFTKEKEVRALLWLLDSGDSYNRNYDIDNRVYDRPLFGPPATLPEGIVRRIDLKALVTEIILNPWATSDFAAFVSDLAGAAGLSCPIRPSVLTSNASFIPTAAELDRYHL